MEGRFYTVLGGGVTWTPDGGATQALHHLYDRQTNMIVFPDARGTPAVVMIVDYMLWSPYVRFPLPADTTAMENVFDRLGDENPDPPR